MPKNPSKRILILSSSFGQGHMATASALASAAEAHPELGLVVSIIDFSDEISHIFNQSSKRIYDINSKHIPAMHKFMYASTDINHTPIRIANLLTYPTRKNHLRAIIKRENPDLIISNYPIWQYLSLQVSKKAFPDVEFATLITDSITVHSSWVIPDSDFYIVANEPTASSLQKLGVANNKINALGYPVHQAFSEPTRKLAITKKFGLAPDSTLVLFSASALRSSYVRRVCREISAAQPETAIIVVAGRDQDLHDALEQDDTWQTPNTRLVGWATDMPELIKASNLVITKAGGSTVMECIAAEKPMIINKIIPGQEEGNAELVERFNLGIVTEKPKDIARSVTAILSELDGYHHRLAQHAQPQAALAILKFLSQRINQASTQPTE